MLLGHPAYIWNIWRTYKLLMVRPSVLEGTAVKPLPRQSACSPWNTIVGVVVCDFHFHFSLGFLLVVVVVVVVVWRDSHTIVIVTITWQRHWPPRQDSISPLPLIDFHCRPVSTAWGSLTSSSPSPSSPSPWSSSCLPLLSSSFFQCHEIVWEVWNSHPRKSFFYKSLNCFSFVLHLTLINMT